MDDHFLDNMLQVYTKQPLPPVPTNLEQNVWREIRLRKTQPESSFAWIRELSLTPRMVFTSFAVALILGFSLASFYTGASKPIVAQQALELQVFSSSAGGLPSTLLGGRGKP